MVDEVSDDLSGKAREAMADGERAIADSRSGRERSRGVRRKTAQKPRPPGQAGLEGRKPRGA